MMEVTITRNNKNKCNLIKTKTKICARTALFSSAPFT